eukprot:TRINITY_DN5106_c0_g1_i1.p1 TRINITY_DN5106_c0_g1~~TRINITY_DN5106_c0_g1_i1.p1  ORF type:complete len:122 (+),score=3.93 TRINITY_DN5106_c0_g1_i1:247-612(+)
MELLADDWLSAIGNTDTPDGALSLGCLCTVTPTYRFLLQGLKSCPFTIRPLTWACPVDRAKNVRARLGVLLPIHVERLLETLANRDRLPKSQERRNTYKAHVGRQVGRRALIQCRIPSRCL